MGLMGLVPLCHHTFVGPKFFLVGYVWLQDIFFFFLYFVGSKFTLWVFHGFRIFSCGYFVGLIFFLVTISWVQYLLSWVFFGSKIF